MNLKSKLHQPSFGIWIGMILAVLLGFIFLNPFFGQALNDWSYDLPFSFRTPARPDELVLVYMDEESHQVLGQPFDKPWDRTLHAKLVDRLSTEASRTVILDIVMSDTNAVADAALAAAMRRHGKVILGSHLLQVGDLAPGMTIEEPNDLLLSQAAGTGVVELLLDRDTTVRQFFPEYHKSFYAPTLTWKAAELEGKLTRDTASHHQGRWLNYYGPPGTLESVSYYRALNEVSAGYFNNKVVLVGVRPKLGFTGAGKDTFRSPFLSGGPLIAGLELHGTILVNLLKGEWLRRLPPLVEFGLIILAGALLGFSLPRFRPLSATAIAGTAMLTITVLAFYSAWQLKLWFPWMIVVFVQIPAALCWTIMFHSIKSYIEIQFLARSLALYLSPKQVEKFLKQPELLRPGGVQQRVSILFSDIANFSKISERMEPEDLVKLLNQYYEAAISCIHQTDGTVMKLIGDAIFALWNAPQEQADHQERACRAALLLQEKLRQFDERRLGPPLHTRIALHTGKVCVGNIGSSTHFDYTAIGKAVNLAFRLEGLNKFLETNILATHDIILTVDHQLVSRLVGHFKFKGFDDVVEIYELIATREHAAVSQPWRESFAQGLHHFQHRTFGAAEKAFLATREIRPDDGPSKFYLEKIQELRGVTLPRDWSGEIDIKEK